MSHKYWTIQINHEIKMISTSQNNSEHQKQVKHK